MGLIQDVRFGAAADGQGALVYRGGCGRAGHGHWRKRNGVHVGQRGADSRAAVRDSGQRMLGLRRPTESGVSSASVLRSRTFPRREPSRASPASAEVTSRSRTNATSLSRSPARCSPPRVPRAERQPLLGRDFTADDERKRRSGSILGYTLWKTATAAMRTRSGRDPPGQQRARATSSASCHKG
jgi:hypothetical protein